MAFRCAQDILRQQYVASTKASRPKHNQIFKERLVTKMKSYKKTDLSSRLY